MSNMSYCRFRNTLNDLRDCKEALDDAQNMDEEDLPQKGSEEHWAMLRLIEVCQEIVDSHDPEDHK